MGCVGWEYLRGGRVPFWYEVGVLEGTKLSAVLEGTKPSAALEDTTVSLNVRA